MRTHKQIIGAAGGPLDLAAKLAPELAADGEVMRKRVWAWHKAESIPGEYWPLLERCSVATVTELAAAAEARKFPHFLPKARRRRSVEGRAA